LSASDARLGGFMVVPPPSFIPLRLISTMAARQGQTN
jgi:hypothetical protein